MGVRQGEKLGGGGRKEIYPIFPHCAQLTEKVSSRKLSKNFVGAGGGVSTKKLPWSVTIPR
jgi:hypothetical protein